MKKFDVIVFDFDGTLSETREAVVRCCQEVFRGYVESERVPSVERIRQTIAKGLTLENSFIELAPASLAGDKAWIGEAILRYRKDYARFDASLSTLYPHVRETLEKFAASDIRSVILSNKGEAAVKASLARHDIIQCFDLIAADRPGYKGKPDPEIFRLLISPSFPDVTSDRFLMVGDTIADIAFARNAGIDSCWASYGYGGDVPISDATFRIRFFAELGDIVI